jgi:signal transduction histidine kinase
VFQSIVGSLEVLWRAHPSLRPSREQRRARLAAGLLLAMMALAFVGFLLPGATGPRPGTAIAAGSILFLSAAYLLVRLGLVKSGIALALATMETGVWLARLSPPPGVDGEAFLPFLAAPILLGGLLLPLRWAAGFALLTLAAFPGLEAYQDGRFAFTVQHAFVALHLLTTGVLAVGTAAMNERDARLLEEHGRALETAAAARRRLLHQVSHDMSNPLSPIQIQIQVLRRPGADLQGGLDLLARNVERLRHHVDDLKDLSRIEGNALRLVRAPFDLAAVVRESAASFAAPAQQRGVTLEVQATGPIIVDGDRTRFDQVLYNLLGNALKFTPAGGHVRLDVDAHGGHAVVRVTDSGRGLDADGLDRLFKPFSQAHRPGEVAERGSGLGLFITKGLVEAHGGTIRAASDGPGKGSTFTIEVPLWASLAEGRTPKTAPNPA